MDRIDVLDHGYVRLVGVLGDDLTVVNSARVSYDKESQRDIVRVQVLGDQDEKDFWGGDITYSETQWCLKPRDKKLLRYLAEHNHTSPFRHCVLSFEVYAPLMVMRQWGKYRTGSHLTFEGSDSDDSLETWNESSRRYVTEEPVFYIPDEWRAAAEHAKQGSGEAVDELASSAERLRMALTVRDSLKRYQKALANGICPEQARLFLPAYAMYIRARWTVSLQGVLHFLQQRLNHDAQREIQLYAEAVRDLAQPHFPESFEVWGL